MWFASDQMQLWPFSCGTCKMERKKKKKRFFCLFVMSNETNVSAFGKRHLQHVTCTYIYRPFIHNAILWAGCVNSLVQPVRITPSQTNIYIQRAHRHIRTQHIYNCTHTKQNQPTAVCCLYEITKWRLKKEKTDFHYIFVGGNSPLTVRLRWIWRRLCILAHLLLSFWFRYEMCARSFTYIFSCDFITHMHHTVRYFNFIWL